jgi:CheY-like chemotaxis protein
MKKIGEKPESRSSWAPVRADREQILYVEDDDDNFRVAELRLGEVYDLVRAVDSDGACRELRSRGSKLAAILMDIELRGSELNGVELTELIRGKLSRDGLPLHTRNVPVLDIPIIFVTAHGAKYADTLLLRAGGDKVIPKPVDFGALSLALTQLHLSRIQRRRPGF